MLLRLSMVIKSIVIAVASLVLASQAFAIELNLPERKVLVLIGYADGPKGEFFGSVAAKTEFEIERFLVSLGYRSSLPNWFEKKDHSTKYFILNSNQSCPGETGITDQRLWFVCDNQLSRSLAVKDFLFQSVKEFDDFIYIGHARMGIGLGIGPFREEFTVDLKFYNEQEQGRLKRIFLSSCDSEHYYRKKFPKSVEVVGLSGRPEWLGQMLPRVKRWIHQIHLGQ